MKFDLTSDIHLDFWVGVNGNHKKQQSSMRKLIDKLLPHNKSDVLVIAGDIGHYNFQNGIFLGVLKTYYRDVIVVPGNHDYYLVSLKAQKANDFSSFNRINEMIQIAGETGTHWLNGTTVCIDGAVFGGCGMWYDDSYAQDKFFMRSAAIQNLWEENMNDSQRIMARPNRFDRHAHFMAEYEKMRCVVDKCDVVVSHICPTADLIPRHRHNPVSTFYQFNGMELIDLMKPSAVWCYGHIHDESVARVIHDRTFYCSPLGYNDEVIKQRFWWDHEIPESRKFMTIEVNP